MSTREAQMQLTTPPADIGQLAPSLMDNLAFGVRFEPQFALMDNSGQLVDAILRTEGTPFGPETFPLAQSSPTDRLLMDEDKNIHITQQDAILQWEIKTRNLKKIEVLGADFQDFVLEPLRQVCKVRGVTRYGVLIQMRNIKIASLKNRPIDRYLAADFANANSLAMRFTRKLPSDEALVKRSVDDYRNVIYTLAENEGVVNISLDYQEYFKPSLDNKEWGEKTFVKFLARGLGYFVTDFQRWFKAVSAAPAEVA